MSITTNNNNYKYISGIVTDGFVLCEDLRQYLANEIQKGSITIKTTSATNRVIIDSPKFQSNEPHFVCLIWNNKENRIKFVWRNDKGEIRHFDTLPQLVADVLKELRNEL